MLRPGLGETPLAQGLHEGTQATLSHLGRGELPAGELGSLLGELGTLAAAVMVVTARKLFHAALWLLLAFFGIAGLYVLLEAPFFAAAQLFVYMGAIGILIIFSVMLTRGMMRQPGPQVNDQHWLVLNYMRQEYFEKGTGPTVRKLGKASGVTTKELFQLFPKGPAKLAALCAGIPKPRGCI